MLPMPLRPVPIIPRDWQRIYHVNEHISTFIPASDRIRDALPNSEWHDYNLLYVAAVMLDLSAERFSIILMAVGYIRGPMSLLPVHRLQRAFDKCNHLIFTITGRGASGDSARPVAGGKVLQLILIYNH
jgi:hypothetical protein